MMPPPPASTPEPVQPPSFPPAANGSLPRKAIPPARDRLQSHLLVWIAIPTLCYLTFSLLCSIATSQGWSHLLLDPSVATFAKVAALSVAFGGAAWWLKAATPLGAVCGGTICLLITQFSHTGARSSLFRSGISPLFLLFVLTFISTRLGRPRKAAAGLAESRRGRDAAQIVANLGIAALFSSHWGEHLSGWIVAAASRSPGLAYSGREGHTLYMRILWLPMLAALAEATADTVSSEIGQAFGGTPRMLLTLRPVPPGTDGAITPLGTLAGIAAAALVTASAIPALGMTLAESTLALAAATAGLFFDSLLGATVERRGWINNDLVNFLSTAFAAALSLTAIRFLQRWLLH